MADEWNYVVLGIASVVWIASAAAVVCPSVAMIRAAICRDDMLQIRWVALGVFWLPPLAIVASGFASLDPLWRTAIWVGALGIMGAGCMTNALRCGRTHCYFTGPFFLVMALAALPEQRFDERTACIRATLFALRAGANHRSSP